MSSSACEFCAGLLLGRTSPVMIKARASVVGQVANFPTFWPASWQLAPRLDMGCNDERFAPGKRAGSAPAGPQRRADRADAGAGAGVCAGEPSSRAARLSVRFLAVLPA